MIRVYKLVCRLVNNQPLIEMLYLHQKFSENTYFILKRIYNWDTMMIGPTCFKRYLYKNRASLCVTSTSTRTEQRKANLLDEKGSTILKTAIETPLVFEIYSNLEAIRPFSVWGEGCNIGNEKPLTTLSDMDDQIIMEALPTAITLRFLGGTLF